MTFDEILGRVLQWLQRQGRVSYRALKRRFAWDDDDLEDLKAELIKAQRLATDEGGDVLVWTGGDRPPPPFEPEPTRRAVLYSPPHLAEKIPTSKTALEGERKQVTVLFADLKGSMELLADRDPKEARQVLDDLITACEAALRGEAAPGLLPSPAQIEPCMRPAASLAYIRERLQLLKGLMYVPRVIVTDQLTGYGAAKREILPGVEHHQLRYLNNRAENSHQPTRQRERRMLGFKALGHAQRFLFAYGPITQHFRPRRHWLPAPEYCQEMTQRFQIWQEITGTRMAA